MAIRASSPTLALPLPWATVFGVLNEVLLTQGMTVKSVDPATGIITAKSSVSFASWGENVAVRTWAIDQATTGIVIESALTFGLVDWGKNRRNINGLVTAIHARLGIPQANPAL